MTALALTAAFLLGAATAVAVGGLTSCFRDPDLDWLAANLFFLLTGAGLLAATAAVALEQLK